MFKIREESSEGIRMTMAMDDSERIESPFYIRFSLLRSAFELFFYLFTVDYLHM